MENNKSTVEMILDEVRALREELKPKEVTIAGPNLITTETLREPVQKYARQLRAGDRVQLKPDSKNFHLVKATRYNTLSDVHIVTLVSEVVTLEGGRVVSVRRDPKNEEMSHVTSTPHKVLISWKEVEAGDLIQGAGKVEKVTVLPSTGNMIIWFENNHSEIYKAQGGLYVTKKEEKNKKIGPKRAKELTVFDGLYRNGIRVPIRSITLVTRHDDKRIVRVFLSGSDEMLQFEPDQTITVIEDIRL